jgi:hypothetical protein
MRRLLFSIFSAILAALGGLSVYAQHANSEPVKPRVVITADPELDDNDTLIRAILYTTDFDLEGLVYTSSCFHWKGDGKGTTQYRAGREYALRKACPNGCTSWRWPDPDKEKFIDDIVDAYAKSYANLKVHNRRYPEPAILKSKIKWGNVDFEGDYSKDTDGSNLIKSLLLDNQPGPLFVTAQGGQGTIARALKSIYDQYHLDPQWNQVRDKVSHKLIIIPWGDQDGIYASYIKPNWPKVANWSLAMVEYGYGIRNGLASEDRVYVSGAWTRENILNRGPLGALYRVWGDGKRMSRNDVWDIFGFNGYTADQLHEMGYVPAVPIQEKDSFISEGDTPTFLNLLNNGLRAYVDGNWGGWGGIRRDEAAIPPMGAPGPRRSPDDRGLAPGLGTAGVKNPNIPDPASASSRVAPEQNWPGKRRVPSVQTAIVNAKFFAASQNDFAARLKWSVTPSFKDANHEPKASIEGPLDISATPGSTIHLHGQVSDPGGNAVKATWWQYNDAGTYPGNVRISDPSTLAAIVEIPADAKPGQTIHVILEATNNGVPTLTSYQRLVITVK